MRTFEEETGGTPVKEIVVILTKDEALTITMAMDYFVANNKRMVKAKKLSKEINSKWSIY